MRAMAAKEPHDELAALRAAALKSKVKYKTIYHSSWEKSPMSNCEVVNFLHFRSFVEARAKILFLFDRDI